jgi:hypothetical protein
MAKRLRKTYTARKRAEILASATKETPTANEVNRKFGRR